jgi:hypothetical protein
MDMQQALDLIKVPPDLKITGSDSILFIHRHLENGSIYFISNQKNVPVSFSTAFRIAGKRPELWDAVSGAMRELPAYSQSTGVTSIPMQLAPLESAFVVFRNKSVKSDASRSNYPVVKETISIGTPWVVNFDKAMRGPANPVVFATLSDWSVNANDSIRYFSGTAHYHTTFRVDKFKKGVNYVIDLGVALSLAKVTVNGIEMGGVWTPPYRVDITKAVKAGDNKLDIKVVNTWLNRLVGDSRLPADQRKATAQYGPNAQTMLEPSGLLGPVKIEMVGYE